MKLSQDTWNKLQSHPYIKVAVQPNHPHISSVNFTKKAFWGKNWDEMTLKARGLFINTETLDIVARSYQKFFNIGERPETQMEALKSSLKFPLRGFQKENGFLGIIGWDNQTNSLFMSSKSASHSEFSGWFRTIFDAQGSAYRRIVEGVCKNQDSSIVYEVIDPVNDPHIIEYSEPKLVALDIISNSEDLQVTTAAKKQLGVWYSWKEFEDFLGSPTMFYGYESLGKIEGVVFQDANEFQFKGKSAYYSYWKAMRGLKDQMLRSRSKTQSRAREQHWQLKSPEANKFYEWCLEQPDKVLEKNIIEVRKIYESV